MVELGQVRSKLNLLAQQLVYLEHHYRQVLELVDPPHYAHRHQRLLEQLEQPELLLRVLLGHFAELVQEGALCWPITSLLLYQPLQDLKYLEPYIHEYLIGQYQQIFGYAG